MAWPAKELREEGHEYLLAVPTDIASESSVTDAYERMDSQRPPVVGLVNLAGIACIQIAVYGAVPQPRCRSNRRP